MYTTSITQKGQVTIPVHIRRKLALKTGQKVAFEEKGNDVVIKPIPNFLSLMGSIKTKNKFAPKAWDKAVGKLLAKEHLEKLARESR